MSNLGQLLVFLSYSSKDRSQAVDIKCTLEMYGITVFVAHEDMANGEIWKKELKTKLRRCDVFAVLLSENYHQSIHTDQEFGMALAYKKPIQPINLDGTMPYGFMGDFNSTNFFKTGKFDVEKLASEIVDSVKDPETLFDFMISKMADADFSDRAGFWAEKLHSVDGEVSNEQVLDIINAVKNNDQVRRSTRAKNILRKWFGDEWVDKQTN